MNWHEDSGYEVVLRFAFSRTTEGDDLASILRQNLGDEATITAELDDTGAVAAYALHMWFPTPEAAFDGALAIRNFMAAEGWPCIIGGIEP